MTKNFRYKQKFRYVDRIFLYFCLFEKMGLKASFCE